MQNHLKSSATPLFFKKTTLFFEHVPTWGLRTPHFSYLSYSLHSKKKLHTQTTQHQTNNAQKQKQNLKKFRHSESRFFDTFLIKNFAIFF